ncbi:nucleoside-diphosphate-sugar pyrophosphorylase (plasmid) [Haloferax mediterranei ATCC 33500]|uniref:Bifunctional protein GlmU n=1 Tax=Haloferax mediterranei (strain ATCC 33500 / DSM 1411 / JCM 8866 / NBRC 14739 / NCIMB 2177 / R-4) TaxID=523841 RepID=I3RB16_HALMT|nr:sugar phosphate nucleotidyltransferase [Haloferax mediterranei]AFK21426.1 glucose-1-phosphate thymidylyltransferase [Haloferax mediterranei ATCC 33500]AHZ24504.1 nucleoside-diphosphate-sugar pyrophosphorylase [Haloferax mediterranei ATCC 33500]ELZ97256.1 glucose-1-phosphate thymidylyltransferase [Haloferax mediterranei ATCC 33500]MDX5990442.1 sugar phosphate nucleotidyltransferase [Haloferax mediterranei ATCC 33500]QCQ76902.1 nucleoside-diphosphate-sugar pyrophosphorylase [Haloferax mediter
MNDRVTEAVVLAAGEGRRLRPLTTFQPKPMLPVANRPVVEYVLDSLFECGIEHVVVVVGHRADRIQTHLSATYPDADIDFVQQDSRLGSGHALLQADTQLDGPFVVCNGDNVVNADIVSKVLERFSMTNSVATVAVAQSDTPEEYGVVVEDNGRISDIDEHAVDSESYLVNAGVYVFDTTVFDALRRIPPQDGEIRLPEVVQYLDSPVTSVLVSSGWLDPSHPWGLLSVTESLLARRHASVIADSARIHGRALVEEPVIVGDDCDVGPGAVISAGSCLQNNVTVGANTVIERSILSTDARIGAGVVLRDSVVGPGAHVGDGVISPGGQADVILEGRLYTDRRLGSIIGDRAEVGANVTLTPGSRVGAEAVVGEGTVLHGDVRERVEVTH